ncbi:MAG: hypothetical protein U0797_04445 [Gemmataceae bacterium]
MVSACPARRARTRGRPALERLEDRSTPATVTLIGSTLTISNPRVVLPTTQLDIAQLGAGKFKVTENVTSNLGTYSNVSAIVINGSNSHDAINVTLGAAPLFLSGSLTINGGNGNDVVSVNGTGEVRGNLSIDGGNGDDTVRVANATGLTVRGTTNLSGGLGTDAAQVAFGGAAKFLGTLGFFGFNSFNYLIANTTLGSGLTFSSRINPTSGALKPVAISAGTGAIAISGTFLVELSSAGDSINVNATSVGALAINMGGGTDSVTINTDVTRNAAVNFGKGDGTITVAGGADINTSLTAGLGLSLAMGDGVNTYNLNNAFVVNGNLAITTPATGLNNQTITVGGQVLKTSVTSGDGNLTINTGFGDDVVTVNTLVAGNLVANLGQGNNGFTVNAAGSFANLTFTAGDGNNTVNVAVPNPVGTHNLTLTFGGGGVNNVTLTGGASGGGTVTINWTDGIVDDTLVSTLGAGYTIVQTGVK